MTVRTKHSQSTTTARGVPIVAVGASAGGLSAFTELLSALPDRTGLAWVFVVHMDPDFDSQLAQVLEVGSPMPVQPVGNGLEPIVDHVYVSVPGMRLTFQDSAFAVKRHLRGKHPPHNIDTFMMSLAKALGPRAAGVLLSGSGNDGVKGLQAVQTRGGYTLVQEPGSAEFAAMAENAIAAGVVNKALPVTELAEELLHMAQRPELREMSPDKATQMLEDIFSLLADQSGNDFNKYKRSTLQRRLEKRMQSQHISDPEEYLQLLHISVMEREALFYEFLIRVTAFFRDEDAFELLKSKVFADLIAQSATANRPIRIWAPACASGEEVYTIAICLLEAAGGKLPLTNTQIFGTDIDPLMIAQARAGVYSTAATANLTPQRLERYFQPTDTGYQIQKPVREMCSFAVQNLTRDPPFSRVDLICCRNLLIYLRPEVQEQILNLFHFALNPGGRLILGSAESLGRDSRLFATVNKPWRLFEKLPVAGNTAFGFKTPLSSHRDQYWSEHSRQSAGAQISTQAEQLLLARYAPPGVIIDEHLNIVHFRGHTGPFLDPSPGAASLNLLAIARQELTVDLRIALHNAMRDRSCGASRQGERLNIDGVDYQVTFQVIPLPGTVKDDRWYLVLFEKRLASSVSSPAAANPHDTQETLTLIEALESQVQNLRSDLQTTTEIHEATTEELRSANEEIQSSNEELESSGEELQSSNEELQSVNDELQRRNQELNQSYSDLKNLLACTGIAIIVLDKELRIHHFTPWAQSLLNLTEADHGRIISTISLPFDSLDLAGLAHQTLAHQETDSIEVQSNSGSIFILRTWPYLNLGNEVCGCVFTLFDITARIQAENTARRMAGGIEHSQDAVLVFQKDGVILEWNHGAEVMYGWNRSEAVGINIFEFIPEHQHERARQRLINLQAGVEFPSMEVQRRTRDGDILDVWLSIATMTDRNGELLITTIERDITAQQRDQRELLKLNTAVEQSPAMILICDPDARIRYVNRKFIEISGYSREDLYGQTPQLLQSGLTPAATYTQLYNTISSGIEWRGELCNKKKNGDYYWVNLVITPVLDKQQHITHYIGFEQDITQSRKMLETISHQASHDALTGLVNRSEFEHRLDRLLSRKTRSGPLEKSAEHALCYLDLDQFKVINDNCGHIAGDELLRQLAVCINREVRQRDTLARLGGDEFAILMEHCTLGQAERLAESLRVCIEDFTFQWADQSYRLGVSIGLVAIDNTACDKTSLLQHADAACYMAKEKGRNRVQVYREEDRELSARHGQMQWVARIQSALDNDRFILFAQPVQAIGPDPETGMYLELLLRMIDTEGDLIPPGAFLPAAERYDLALHIDCWVVEKAFTLLQSHPEFLHNLAHCCINLSGASIADGSFQHYLETLLEESDLPAHKICFEITETAAIANLSDAVQFINALRQRGCLFSLDDFGSGLSSFAYLKNLPVDYLKIDGIFVKDIETDQIDFATVRSINEIGQLMGKQTIAEYVESAAILEQLKSIGVQYAQGYHIGKPRPFSDYLQAKD